MYKPYYNFILSQKGKNLCAYQVGEGENVYTLVTHFNSPLENKRFADAFMKEFGLEQMPEGYSRGEWIIFDLGEVIIHSFAADKREKYNLDKLWQNRRVDGDGQVSTKKTRK